MPIVYDKLFNHKTLARLCEKFDCQPGELMEYVKDTDVQEKG